MNTNTSEFLKKWGGLLVTLVLLILATILIRHTSKPAAVASPDAATLTPGLATASTSLVSVSSNPATGAAAPTSAKNTTYQDPAWSIRFTLRPEWNVNDFLDGNKQTHQFQISSKTLVIFISKNEAIGLSDDLKYTTSMRTIAGQSVSVRTYTRPSAQFAQYQLFTIKGTDGSTYAFLIKNVSTDTAQTDAFINSISNS
ncbi:hypothetical protein BH11PAT2_BH11PAT2_01150 [soil metagenome]